MASKADKAVKYVQQRQAAATDAAARRMLRLVEEYRIKVAQYLATFSAGDWSLYRLSAIKRGISEITEWFYENSMRDMPEDLRKAFINGIYAADKPLEAGGYRVMLPYVPQKILEDSQELAAHLIKGLSVDMAQRVNTEISLGLLGQKSPWEVMKNLETFIPPLKNRRGLIGSAFSRAETIARTEMGRVQNAALRDRVDQIAEKYPALKKAWLGSGKPTSRPAHMALQDNEPIGINEDFVIHGYKCSGPHDPRLPASETINCGCSMRVISDLTRED